MADERAGRALPLAGLAGLVLGSALMGLLHLLPLTSDGVDPVRRTISEYALGPGRLLFDVAVLLVAAGSAAVFVTLVRSGRARPFSAATIFGGAWTLCLLVIVAFQKTDWSIGPSVAGTIHRYASVVAFVCLPLAVFAAARAAYPHSPGPRLVARVLSLLSLAWFGLILGAVFVMLAGGEPWWRAIPLGLVERLLALNEVLAIAALVPGLLRLRSPAPATAAPLVPS
ncbi:DUF998 domain-containing protein [Prauserella cavernicola]|uniref:DUF998 domain-containing protein n=1 Tax=Prauserella cavernicola TaxID=2800127 RepID=A0A934V767_9PSEU|nr:DUF998 domain-containing protein [Prauserella cavernicola]MBK1788262.1 DUF998 domain-containing protein [Prauserella cavernicola]